MTNGMRPCGPVGPHEALETTQWWGSLRRWDRQNRRETTDTDTWRTVVGPLLVLAAVLAVRSRAGMPASDRREPRSETKSALLAIGENGTKLIDRRLVVSYVASDRPRETESAKPEQPMPQTASGL